MKKGSIQVSAGFLVMMILALVAFGLGVTFLYNIMGQVGEATDSINDQTKDQIERILLEPGMKVALPYNKVDIERGDKKIVAYGVRNTLDDTEEFTVTAECKKAYNSSDGFICDDDGGNPCESPASDPSVECDTWITNNGRKIEVGKKERKVEKLFFIVPDEAKYGKYIYNLRVEKDSTSCTGSDCIYDTEKRFYITVS